MINRRKDYEAVLNALYSDNFTIEEIVEQFGHFYSNEYRARLNLQHHYKTRTMGKVVRWKDPQAFTKGYREWRGEQSNKQRMAIQKTHKDYEQYLNDFYWETYNLGQAQELLGQYYADGRGWEIITKAYYKKKLGTIFRRKDPIAFYAGFNDWNV